MRMLGNITLIDDRECFLKQKELGLDALRDVDKSDKFVNLLENKRGMIKTALMDQSLMAGIGNECSDEILFQSRIHPKEKVSELGKDELITLFNNMRSVLKTKIEAGMGTENLPGSYILKHRSEGAQCLSCGGSVATVKVGWPVGLLLSSMPVQVRQDRILRAERIAIFH